MLILSYLVCEDGTYGKNCVHNCSGNCLNDYPCNKQSGHCDGGCKPGYNNLLCNERMLIMITGFTGKMFSFLKHTNKH